jgi:hypothetical protein
MQIVLANKILQQIDVRKGTGQFQARHNFTSSRRNVQGDFKIIIAYLLSLATG